MLKNDLIFMWLMLTRFSLGYLILGTVLSLVAGMDIFIEKSLFDSQGMPFHAASDRLSIPINTLSTSALKVELEKAVEFENYRLASQIQEELKRRK